LIYNKENTFERNLRKETLPEALKVRTSMKLKCIKPLAPFKISDQEKFDGILLFCPSAVRELFNKQ
jgi:uroporphyrinogen-III synthase